MPKEMHNLPAHRAPVEQFAIDYDLPVGAAAHLLVGKTESETAKNMEYMRECLKSVVEAIIQTGRVR